MGGTTQRPTNAHRGSTPLASRQRPARAGMLLAVIAIAAGLAVLILGTGPLSADSTPTMVKDINPTGTSYPSRLTNANGILYFVASDGVNGTELWKSDGTEAGTIMVKDINPGAGSGASAAWTKPVNVNGTLYFQADDGVNGRELWKSDGTEAGTVILKDIYPGSSTSYPQSLVEMNGILYFRANDGVSGTELWKSDGTAAGTVIVKDINPGSSGSGWDSLVEMDGALYFSASGGVNGSELWKSDGTEAGTVMVKDINSGSVSSGTQWITEVNGTLFFLATDGVSGRALWKSDGSEAGTVMVKDINPGSEDLSADTLTGVDGTVFFEASDGVNGNELWKSDGTEAGTIMVKDIRPGSSSLPGPMANVSGTLFFRANNGVNGHELWKSDGTEVGTVMVKDIRPGPDPSNPAYFLNFEGVLFFNASDGVNGGELWKSDGTEAGTVMIADINPTGSLWPTNLTDMNGVLYFQGNDGVHGIELWKLLGQAVKPTPTPCPGTCPPTVTPTTTPTPTNTPIPTATPTPVYDGEMGLSVVSGGDCSLDGTTCYVPLGAKFEVSVDAIEIPQDGYITAVAWIHYGDELGDQGNQGDIKADNITWPDCSELGVLIKSTDEGGIANIDTRFFYCLTAVISPPPSFHTGSLYTISLTCTPGESTTLIELIPYNESPAGVSGSTFIDPNGARYLPVVNDVTINCVDEATDTDGDGCPDLWEFGTDETQGGLRNFKYPYDYYDVHGPDQSLTLDGVIDLPNDILGVVQHFSPSGASPYDVRFDRGPQVGANVWNMSAPDGVIDLPNDILGVIQQFNHNCQ